MIDDDTLARETRCRLGDTRICIRCLDESFGGTYTSAASCPCGAAGTLCPRCTQALRGGFHIACHACRARSIAEAMAADQKP